MEIELLEEMFTTLAVLLSQLQMKKLKE